MVNLGLGTKPNIKLATSRMGERRRRERRSRSELNRAQPRSQVLSPTRRENPGNEVQASDDDWRRPQTTKETETSFEKTLAREVEIACLEKCTVEVVNNSKVMLEQLREAPDLIISSIHNVVFFN